MHDSSCRRLDVKLYLQEEISEQEFSRKNPSYLSLWRSVVSTPVSSLSSWMEPTQTISSRSSLTHRGMGVPKYRFLEMAQSCASRNQLAKRFSFTNPGTLSRCNGSLIEINSVNVEIKCFRYYIICVLFKRMYTQLLCQATWKQKI